MARLQKVIRGTKGAEEFSGLKRTALDDAIKAGTFPKPIKLGVRAIGWLEDDLIKWQQARIAASE
jgi:prophage regulatory protein